MGGKFGNGQRFPRKAAGQILEPDDVLSKMERLGWHQQVYDGRLHGLVNVEDVAGPEYFLYLDVVPGERGCYVNVLAKSDIEAQHKIGVELATHGYDEILIKWIEGGKQVRHTNDKAPDTYTWQELIARF